MSTEVNRGNDGNDGSAAEVAIEIVVRRESADPLKDR